MTRLIDADALDREMYRKSFEVDDGRSVWNSGLWIQYKIYEEAIRDAPTVEAIPMKWLKDRIRLLKECGADLVAQSLETEIELWKAHNRR